MGASLVLYGLLSAHGPAQAADTAPASKAPPVTLRATGDYRVPTKTQLDQAQARLTTICGEKIGTSLSHFTALAANRPKLTPPQATLIACVMGTPTTATCEEVFQCAVGGEDLKRDEKKATCQGSFLVDKAGGERDMACHAFGAACYSDEFGAGCAAKACEPGDTYFCEGDTLVSCVTGLEVRTPCGRGMTCGRTKGSGVLSCVPAGGDCETDSCDGDTAVQCIPDSFGKKQARKSDCAEMGLKCKTVSTESGQVRALCHEEAQ